MAQNKRDRDYENRHVIPTQSRGIVAKFIDKVGEERIIHRDTRGRLAVARTHPTVVLELTTAAAPLIGQLIRKKREELEMGRTELALRAGLSGDRRYVKHRIQEIEHGKRGGIRFGTLFAFAIVFGCSPTELMPTVDEVLANSSIKEKKVSKLLVDGVVE